MYTSTLISSLFFPHLAVVSSRKSILYSASDGNHFYSEKSAFYIITSPPVFFFGCEFVSDKERFKLVEGVIVHSLTKKVVSCFSVDIYTNVSLTRLLCLNRNIGSSRLAVTAATGRSCTVLSRSGNWSFFSSWFLEISSCLRRLRPL